MHLHRITEDPFNTPEKYLGESSDDFRADTLEFRGKPVIEVVATRFPRFGGGEHRKSDFDVLTEWQDVQKIIEKFCEAKHPEALAIREAMRLAAAAKSLGGPPRADLEDLTG